MAQGIGLILAQMLADDSNSIPYRPKIAKKVKSITATILLQQITYWWIKQGQEPFYKFKKPCKHEFYKDGDSWCEELGFSRCEFDTALGKIAVKKIQNQTIQDAVNQAKEEQKPVVYWINPGRVTYYTVILDILVSIISDAYLKQESSTSKSKNLTLGKVENSLYLEQESIVTISETTSRIPENTSTNVEKFSSFTKEQMSVEIKEDKFGCWNCGEPLTLDDIPESICHCGAPIYVYKEKSFGKKEWVSQPQETGKAVQGSGDFRHKPVNAFMALTNKPSITEKQRSQWAVQIFQIASQRNATPEQAYEAIKAIKDSEYSWMTFRSPYQDSFKDVFDTMLARIMSGEHKVIDLDKTGDGPKVIEL